jgi:PAS domain S-box-containing protein
LERLNPPRQLRIRTAVTYVPAIASAIVILAGLLVLIGWWRNQEFLKSLLAPGHIAMNPATAVAFILCAVSLWLIREESAPNTNRRIAKSLAAIAIAIIVARFADMAFGPYFHVDRLLFHSELRANVMSPNTAVGLLFLGVALMMLDYETRDGFHPSQVPIILAGCIGLLSVTGYMYSTAELYGFRGFKPMALNTAVTFVVLSIGMLCARPEREPMRSLLSDTLGGVVARRLVPAAFLVPLLAGKLQVFGVRFGLYYPEFGMAVLVIVNILAFNILIWWCANAMRVSDVRRRISEEALRNSDERNRAIMQQAAEGIFLVDLESKRILDANTALERLLGYGHGEITNKRVYDLVTDPPEVIDERMQKMAETNTPLHAERRYRRKDGSLVEVETSAGMISYSGRRVVCSAVHDITERKAAEEALNTERTLLRTLIDNIPDSIFIKDTERRYITCNVAHARFAGLASPRDIVGKTVFDLHPRQIAERYDERDRILLETGKPVIAHEESITDSSGEQQWALVSKIPVFDARGQITAVVGITRDITRQKNADQALAAERNLLRTVIDNLPERIYVKDVEGRYMLDNAAHLAHLKLTDPSQVIGKTTRDFFAPEVAQAFERDDQAVIQSRNPLLDREEVSRHEGDTVWLLTTKVPLGDGQGGIRGLVGMSRDITARKKAEWQLEEKNRQLEAAARSVRQAYQQLQSAQSQLVQSEKLAGLGQMVAGVAHEINNPLSFVGNNVAVLQRDVRALTELLALYASADAIIGSQNPDLMSQIKDLSDRMDLVYTQNNMRELLERSREGLRRIQQIVKDLRDFARLDESDLHEVDLNAGIQSTVNIVLGKAKKKRVQIDLELGTLPQVACFPAKVNQVVMNLVSNAIDASPEGGHVLVASKSLDGQVQITVQDHGAGVPPQIRGRIFDPFFTTKPIGEGTGLGLSISYGIVQDHGGTIEVDDAPGGGAIFKVILPKQCNASPK